MKKSILISPCLITAATLIIVSLKKVSSVDYGIQYNEWKKTSDDAAKQGGMYVGPSGYSFEFSSTQITTDLIINTLP